MTGATGAISGTRVLIALCRLNVDWVISQGAEATGKYETDYHPVNTKTLADRLYSINQMAAPVREAHSKQTG